MGHHRLTVLATSAIAASIATGQIINETRKLLPSDGAANAVLGRYVAVDGTIAAIAAPLDESDGNSSGSAYLFDTTTGQQLAKLRPEVRITGEIFGQGIAIDGNIVVVGASRNPERTGATYVFDANTGEQLARLQPSDAEPGDLFGSTVAVSGTRVLVGARGANDNGETSGSAYVFDAITGHQLAKLLPNDGGRGDAFGSSVAIEGTTAIIGAIFDSDRAVLGGSAYLFDVSTGQQLAKLFALDTGFNVNFGISVDLSGSIAIVGADLDANNGSESGAAYLFEVPGGRQIAKLLPSDGSIGDRFGTSVAIDGRTAVVGAYLEDDGTLNNPGAAYLFDVNNGRQIAKLLASDRGDRDSLGLAVAISGTVGVAGAFRDDDNGEDSGSAYVFSTRGPCPADLWGPPAFGAQPDGILTGADFFEFLARFTAGDLSVDFSSPADPGQPDGILTGADFFEFLSLFSAGC